jgi:hypothetical protein
MIRRLDFALLASLLGGLLAHEARAGRILVPEGMSLSAAVKAAQPGDTLSLAPGTYERSPDPFVKSIVIEARETTDPPVLRRLEAGQVTLVHVDFAPEGPGQVNPVLFRVLDSVRLDGCRFSGFATTAIVADDAGSDHGWVLTIDDCRFDDLNRGIDADFAHPASRAVLEGCAFTTSFNGIRLAATPRACAGAGSEPPPLTPGAPVLDLLDCTFDGLSGSAVEAHDAAWAVSLVECRITATGLGLDLVRAGAFLLRCEITGNGFDTTGILASSSRIDVASCAIRGHALGIGLTAGSGCENPAGTIGGQIDRYNRLDQNVLALSTSHPVNADDNWWGSLICSEAQERIQGMTIRFLVDDAGTFEVDCMTPVVPTTWGRLKARIGS